jgi:hypothetical protein
VPARAELTLAALGLIRHTSADSLIELSSARGVVPEPHWNVYSLAKALIEPGAVWTQLSALDRDTLAVIDQIRRGTTASNASLPTGVVDEESGGLRPEVRHAIDTFSSEWDTAMIPTPDSGQSVSLEDPPAGTFSQALPRIVDVLDELGLAIDMVAHRDISQRTASSVSLAKALGQLAPDVSADWVEAVDWGIWSGLLIHQAGSWWVSEQARDFVGMDRATQLATLVTSWWGRGDTGIKSECQSLAAGKRAVPSLIEHLHSLYPLITKKVLTSFVEQGQKLGVFGPTAPTTLFDHLITGKDLAASLAPLMPPHAPGVYPDSVDSMVGAGPLAPEHREALSRVAQCVRAGMAPRWVVDRDIVLASLSQMPASEICELLDGVIIGGMPDLLRQRIRDWESRATSLTLSSDFPGTLLHCQDNYLSELLLVDHKLQTLHLTRVDDTTLSSRRDVGQTRQVLLDGGYPTLPGRTTPPIPKIYPPGVREPLPESWWGEIVDSASLMPRNAVWTEDVLQDAIADRTLLVLTVRVGQTERVMVVEPQSIARGRLRVKDTAADVERTLPLDTIASIHPAQPPVTKTA